MTWLNRGAERRGRHDHRDDSGNEAAQAALPKPLEIDAPRALVLTEQQACDQVARQDEEHGDALHAAGNEAGIEVVEHDGSDGEGADAVKRRDVGYASLASRCVRGVQVGGGGGPKIAFGCRGGYGMLR